MKLLVFTFMLSITAKAQEIKGYIYGNNSVLPGASLKVIGSDKGAIADKNGYYQIQLDSNKTYFIEASFVGFDSQRKKIDLQKGEALQLNWHLTEQQNDLNEVVVTGTLKEVSRLNSPVNVEVYSKAFFKKSPSSSVLESMGQVNGVRPQLNCNVCNTGDIHINGMEGPYTMVLIDGVPIVSGLSTVYGLSGIPMSMIERVEVVKGPASTLYGSEAVGGLINIITNTPDYAPVFSADVRASSWLEYNADMGYRKSFKNIGSVLTGINLFSYQNPIDHNDDNFTDLTLQQRASIFQKWQFKRKNKRIFSLAGRYYYEDRWGGEMQWEPKYRGGDEVYGESIYTQRLEFIGKYQLPLPNEFMFTLSYNSHNQDAVYGNTIYKAQQNIFFSQLTYAKTLGKNDLLAGIAFRQTLYDDSTPATVVFNENQNIGNTALPGVFIQNSLHVSDKHELLLGMRYDYHATHGSIYTPRLAYKWKTTKRSVLRLNAGTGFRVVNLFTEEHAALTGARQVVVNENLGPEKSYNINLNYLCQWLLNNGSRLTIDAGLWHTTFSNQILPDYDADPQKIIYSNLDGKAISQGINLNTSVYFANGLKTNMGFSYMDVYSIQKSIKTTPVLTEKISGVWSASYILKKWETKIDYTANIYGPMRLPRLGDTDPRDEYSPWWSIQNIQITYAPKAKKWEIYGGVKNLLNFTPASNSIARAHDPFDKNVIFDSQGQVVATAENPYALTFDPSYVYAPNQGIRAFLGVRYVLY